jgi:heme oxygenase (biliverdin-IX-beta and delta-forming)
MIKATARTIRQLLDGQRVLTLAVISDGAPFAGLLPFVPLADYSAVLVHASRLSKHGAALAAGGRAGILLFEQDGPDKDPLQLKRATFDCDVRGFERKGEEWLAGRELYLRRFPDSRITFNLGDFTLYRLGFREGLYVGGFGRAVEVPPGDLPKIATLGA